jgi:hypothetical protein
MILGCLSSILSSIFLNSLNLILTVQSLVLPRWSVLSLLSSLCLPYLNDQIVLLPLKVLKRWDFRPEKSCLVLQPHLYFLSYLGTSSCPTGDFDGLADPCFSLQPRRPQRKFPLEIMLNTKKTISIKWVLSIPQQSYLNNLVPYTVLCLSPAGRHLKHYSVIAIR